MTLRIGQETVDKGNGFPLSIDPEEELEKFQKAKEFKLHGGGTTALTYNELVKAIKKAYPDAKINGLVPPKYSVCQPIDHATKSVENMKKELEKIDENKPLSEQMKAVLMEAPKEEKKEPVKPVTANPYRQVKLMLEDPTGKTRVAIANDNTVWWQNETGRWILMQECLMPELPKEEIYAVNCRSKYWENGWHSGK